MYKLKRNLLTFGFLAVMAFSAHANESIEKCKAQSPTSAKFSICLDEAMKLKDRELKTWIQDRRLELEAMAESTGRTSVVMQFNKANDFYLQFIESECRGVFFEKQHEGNPADEYRSCKIKQTDKRIDQLKTESANRK
ncbi:DUF1311 domain-containing protein [Catenovulum sp. SM1970]|uniref:lysozyme inhibitor LprI family protein n=1 Tax=Marinifaba aquimaris TaxID=2741323 RepID=UPI0015742E52|nr:lysozyme inhibitor LprI family protein [Marinifaba aquimaris]NTS78397.1 DUF1311 domain-containing protein [Marinifaba aquimaris]